MTVNKVIIYNPVNYHYECIESIIHYLPKILADKILDPKLDIILNILPNDEGFIKYISTYNNKLLSKYSLNSITISDINQLDVGSESNIIIPSTESEARIILTIHREKYIENITAQNEQYTYLISHYYLPSRSKSSNIFYLAPYCGIPDQFFIPIILPFSPHSVSYIPRQLELDPCNKPLKLLIQGLISKRNLRHMRILCQSLINANNKAVKICKPGINLYILTRNCKKLSFLINKNIIIKINTDFWEFNKIASECDIILTLVSKKTNPDYYNKTLTSSISYGLGYKIPFIIDNALASIYNITSDSNYIYSSTNEFRRHLTNIFNKHLTTTQSHNHIIT